MILKNNLKTTVNKYNFKNKKISFVNILKTSLYIYLFKKKIILTLKLRLDFLLDHSNKEGKRRNGNRRSMLHKDTNAL